MFVLSVLVKTFNYDLYNSESTSNGFADITNEPYVAEAN